MSGSLPVLVVSIVAFVFIAGYLLAGLTIVDQRERRPVLRFGKYLRTLGPGVRWIEPLTNKVAAPINIQDCTKTLTIASVPTHDNIPIAFDMLLTYRIAEANVESWFLVVGDDKSLYSRAVAVVSEVVSRTELDELLHDRKLIYGDIVAMLQIRIARWGYEIEAVEIRDLKITDESIAEAISLKARASKEGDAELAKAVKQKEIADALNEAAEAYTEKGRWLKGQETLLELCRSGENNTILIPTDMAKVTMAFDPRV